jgi:hypothetical protein
MGGQYILGQPLNPATRNFEERLPSVAELYPELIDGTKDDPDLPSCSAIQSLDVNTRLLINYSPLMRSVC